MCLVMHESNVWKFGNAVAQGLHEQVEGTYWILQQAAKSQRAALSFLVQRGKC
jgi:hypothetical protein